ncbi:MAG: ATP-binding protein [Candidatus Omnitrophota bacterium]
MEFSTTFLLFISSLFIILGFFVFFKNWRSPAHLLFFTMSAGISLWTTCIAFVDDPYFLNFLNEGIYLFLLRLLFSSAAVMVTSFFYFTSYFPKKEIREKDYIFNSFFLLAIFFFVLSLTDFVVKDSAYIGGKLIPIYGKGYFVYVTYIISYMIIAIIRLFGRYKKSKGAENIQIKYVLWGIFISSFLIITANIILPGIFNRRELVKIGPCFSLIWFSFTFFAILKHQLLEVKIVISRLGIFLIVYGIVLGSPFLIGFYYKEWFIATILMFVLASLGPLLYRDLQKKTEIFFLAKQRRYQHILLHASQGMVREHSLNKLTKLIAYVVKKVIKNTFAALFINNPEGKCLTIQAKRGTRLLDPDFSFDYDHPLIVYMKNHREPLFFDNLPYDVKESLDPILNIRLIVPSFINHKLVGFLFLGEKINKEPYTHDDINVFKILAQQAALAIDSSMFFEEFKKAQIRIAEAERLISLGALSHGVAHQVNNRLAHFSVVSESQRLKIARFINSYPDCLANNDLKEILHSLLEDTKSLLDNVDSTYQVVRSILNYARTSEKTPLVDCFSLREVLKYSLDLLKVKHQVPTLPVEERLGSVDMIYGIKPQIMEVIYNLVDNAYEATQEVYASLSFEEKGSYNPKIVIGTGEDNSFYFINISDNGIGIKDENKSKIFTTFFTTKTTETRFETKSGTGIGLCLVKKLVEDRHGGHIRFESQYLKGTAFYIELPKKKETQDNIK